MPQLDSDAILHFVILALVLMCAPAVIMTFVGIFTPLRGGTAHRAVGGVVGFVIGVLTIVGVITTWWIDGGRSDRFFKGLDERFLLFYAVCCFAGAIVTVVLTRLIGKIRRKLTARTGSNA